MTKSDAEAMRERAANEVERLYHSSLWPRCQAFCDEVAAAVRALPIPANESPPQASGDVMDVVAMLRHAISTHRDDDQSNPCTKERLRYAVRLAAMNAAIAELQKRAPEGDVIDPVERSIESGKPDDTEAVEAAFEAFDGGYGHSDDRMRAAIGAYMQVQFGGDPQEKIENYRLDFFDTRKELRADRPKRSRL
jgi:hypothetical protein